MKNNRQTILLQRVKTRVCREKMKYNCILRQKNNRIMVLVNRVQNQRIKIQIKEIKLILKKFKMAFQILRLYLNLAFPREMIMLRTDILTKHKKNKIKRRNF